RKKPLEPRKRFRERKIISIENVHSQPPIRFTPTLDVVGVGVKRIGTDYTTHNTLLFLLPVSGHFRITIT
ncbi:MAG: hypothetical protein CMM10_17580, partial [Rhodospirillaceae bacterium]|nr:hypothetical protein [Rhodospirillaceae bacterium]